MGVSSEMVRLKIYEVMCHSVPKRKGKKETDACLLLGPSPQLRMVLDKESQAALASSQCVSWNSECWPHGMF